MSVLVPRRTFLAGLAATPLLSLFDRLTFNAFDPTPQKQLFVDYVGVGHAFSFPGNRFRSDPDAPWIPFTIEDLARWIEPGEKVAIFYTNDPEGEFSWVGRFNPRGVRFENDPSN